jgi:DNA repair exonuclease SbcCD ATPase subunit
LKNKDADILNLRAEIQKVNQLSHEYEKVKHQVQHLETFKSELVKSREETQNNRNEYEKQIKLLNDKIEYLQLTPAKRKKVGQTATVTDKPKATIIKQDLPGMVVKDGGKF